MGGAYNNFFLIFLTKPLEVFSSKRKTDFLGAFTNIF